MKRIIIIILICISMPSFAQTVTKGDVNTWFLVVNRFHLSEKFTVTNEIHERTGSFLSDQGTVIVRPSVDYALNKNVELTAGYSFVRSWPYTPYKQPIARNEHNIWEQAFLKQKVGNVSIQHRFRFEQRFIQHIDAPTNPSETFKLNGTDYANRFRYRFILSFDILKTNKGKNSIFFNGFDELWINQSNNFMPSSFARNWIYTGLGYKFNKDFNIQLAHMHQYDAAGANNFISSSIIQLSVFKNFTLYGNNAN